ncbi:peptidoglycan-binding protein [Desulfosoma sp.]|uniref:peptidoglycan-binding protein n=1 Tax=Desulfosoma sp. TaxID=2603217 RepID=UPI004048FD73
MFRKSWTLMLGLFIGAAFLSACGSMPVQVGDSSAKTVATGSAGGATSANVNASLERCGQPLGTIAVEEDQNSDWYHYLTGQYKLTSTVPVLRLLIQQSNCFIVLDRGRAMKTMMGERALQQTGELRAGSNFGKGQMVSADYSLIPEVMISQKGTGGAGAALGGFGIGGAVAGAILGGLKANEAAVMLMLVDNRSGVQVGAAEGSSKNFDWDLGGAIFGGSAGGALGGYTNTPQGKVIAGAFMDAYNQLVRVAKAYTPQTMGDRQLGTGGRLGVEGSSQPGGYQGATLTLKEAQRKLNALGYEAGTPDGKMGQATRQALMNFQADKGLPVTGRLDAATAAELAK